jgi:polar amino acid transport system substrate-binding protein
MGVDILRRNLLALVLIFPVVSFAEYANKIYVDVRNRVPEMVVEDGRFNGPVIDVINYIAEVENLELVYREVPWPRSLMNAKLGQVDLLPRHSMNHDREKYLAPILLGFENRVVNYLLSPKLKTQVIEFNDLKPLVIGMLRGSFYGNELQKLNDDATIVYSNSIEQLLQMLSAGRVDVVPIQNLSWAENAYQKISEKKNIEKYIIADYNEKFLSGKYLSIPKRSKFFKYYHSINCTVFNMRQNKVLDGIYIRNGVLPFYQHFEHAQSVKQEASCHVD